MFACRILLSALKAHSSCDIAPSIFFPKLWEIRTNTRFKQNAIAVLFAYIQLKISLGFSHQLNFQRCTTRAFSFCSLTLHLELGALGSAYKSTRKGSQKGQENDKEVLKLPCRKATFHKKSIRGSEA